MVFCFVFDRLLLLSVTLSCVAVFWTPPLPPSLYPFVSMLTFVLPLPLLLFASGLWRGAGRRFALFGRAGRLCICSGRRLLLVGLLH